MLSTNSLYCYRLRNMIYRAGDVAKSSLFGIGEFRPFLITLPSLEKIYFVHIMTSGGFIEHSAEVKEK